MKLLWQIFDGIGPTSSRARLLVEFLCATDWNQKRQLVVAHRDEIYDPLNVGFFLHLVQRHEDSAELPRFLELHTDLISRCRDHGIDQAFSNTRLRAELGAAWTRRVREILDRLADGDPSSGAPERPRTIASLLSEARYRFDQAFGSGRAEDYTAAATLFERALALQQQAPGEHPLAVAETLRVLVSVYSNLGDHGREQALARRAVEIRQRQLGADHPEVADVLIQLATACASAGEHEEADVLFRRALEILRWTDRSKPGAPDPGLIQALNNSALNARQMGRLDEAEARYQEVLALLEPLGDPAARSFTACLNNLAQIYVTRAQYREAEAMHWRVLALLERILGADHPATIPSLTNLGNLYRTLGDPEQARLLYERAAVTAQNAWGPDHPELATALDNLASLWIAHGISRVRPMLERSLQIRERALGDRHPLVAVSLNNLALMHDNLGERDTAEALLRRALAITREALGDEHPAVATDLGNLASHFIRHGRLREAKDHLLGAIRILEARFGADHPVLVRDFTRLAKVHVKMERLDEAIDDLRRCFDLTERLLHLAGREYMTELLVSRERAHEDLAYTIAARAPTNPLALALALLSAALRKGRAADSAAQTSREVYRGASDAQREKHAQLQDLRRQLVHGYRSSRGDTEARVQQLRDLAARIEVLERELAYLQPASGDGSREAPVSLPALAAGLPPDGVLVELVSYRPYGSSPASSDEPVAHYLALVLHADGTLGALDLGDARPIDEGLRALLRAIRTGSDTCVEVARALYRRVLEPLVPLLGDRRALFLCADGELSLLPFAALHDGHDYLIARYELHYLTTARDLVRARAGGDPQRVVILADPELRAHPRLPGTRLEAMALQQLLPDCEVLVGSAASKHAMLELHRPLVLHIATHGELREDTPAIASLDLLRDVVLPDEELADWYRRPAPDGDEALSRSGLHLAPDRDTDAADGYVSALEISGMDLLGTELVVLSACDSGRGDVKIGQGVFGLRRAFLIAGARTVVVSLWRVDDGATAELMAAYYRELRAGRGRVTGMTRAMQALRSRYAHPFYWAPFVVIGDWAPLALPGG
jgi:CHAT domain-containing protein/tetratricopeptide (TPR) repeat protein